MKPADYVAVADIEITAVSPEKAGFTLEGRGADRAEYRLGLDLEMPLDQRTRSVLGEMLSQCRIRVWRRVVSPRMAPALSSRLAPKERTPAE